MEDCNMFKVKLDDFSFIIGEGDYVLTVYKFGIFKYRKSLASLVNKKHYKVLDIVDDKIVKREIAVEPTDLVYPNGTRLKYSQDVKVGDLVVGEDRKPRKVTELHTGEEAMYEISVDGETFVVNASHILALVDKETGERMNMPVNVYVLMDDDFKSKVCMEKVDS